MGEVVKRETFTGLSLEKSAELAAIAVSAAAKAEVESAYLMAIKSPRNEEEARVRIKQACQSPLFAAKARYRKPVGGKMINGKWVPDYVQGPSIRFAEEMLRSWRNVLTQQCTIYDDETKRLVKISTRDLEANVSFSKEITLSKTVERRSSKDREILGQRVNTQGNVVYIVKATEDELTVKESAQASKIIRTQGLRLIPQHIIDEAMAEVERVIREKITKDPASERRELLDGFAARGIMPHDLERHLELPNAQWSTEQLFALREVLTAIQDGHTTWAEFIGDSTTAQVEDMEEKSQPGTKGKEILNAPKPPLTEAKATADIVQTVMDNLKDLSEGKPLTQPVEQPAEQPAPQETAIAQLVDGSVDQLRKVPGGSARLMKVWQAYKLPPAKFGKVPASALLPEPTLALFGNEVQKILQEVEAGKK